MRANLTSTTLEADSQLRNSKPTNLPTPPPGSTIAELPSSPHSDLQASTSASNKKVILSTPGLQLTTEAVQDAASKRALTVDDPDSHFHRPQNGLPSPYLQSLCQPCFKVTINELKTSLKGLPDAEQYVEITFL